MLTVVESSLFQKQWPLYWDEDERAEFAVYISANPDVGAVIKGSGDSFFNRSEERRVGKEC